jgi:Tfp pilus assembly protein PilX
VNTPLHTNFLRQRGAALITTLILLLVITVLAIAAMRTTSFGFIQAGNAQLQERAFVAAETGIEQAIAVGVFDPNNLATVTAVPSTAVVGDVGDLYTATITTQLGGAPQGALFGSSWNKFSTYQFQVVSTGTSLRSASSVHTQGIAVLAPYSPPTGPLGGTCGTPPCL